jgi:antitoxin VapB
MEIMTAKVFISGNSQAIRLPKQFRLNVKEIFIYKIGNQLVLTPKMDSWEGFIEGFSGFSNDFAIPRNLPEDTPRRTFQ